MACPSRQVAQYTPFMDGHELEKKALGKKSKFREHINRSRIEFLKAIRSLLDERIEELEKGPSRRGEKKVTKIKVE